MQNYVASALQVVKVLRSLNTTYYILLVYHEMCWRLVDLKVNCSNVIQPAETKNRNRSYVCKILCVNNRVSKLKLSTKLEFFEWINRSGE